MKFFFYNNVSYLVQEKFLRHNIEIFQESIKSKGYARYVS